MPHHPARAARARRPENTDRERVRFDATASISAAHPPTNESGSLGAPLVHLDSEPRPEMVRVAHSAGSASPAEGVPAEPIFHFVTAAELAATEPATVPWLVPPWVASGCLTEIDGKVKAAGKTTFVGAMVRALLQGQDFLGNPTTPTRVVWLTEQSPASFRQVLRRAGLEGRRDLLLLFWYETRGTSWDKVAAAAVARSLAFGAGETQGALV